MTAAAAVAPVLFYNKKNRRRRGRRYRQTVERISRQTFVAARCIRAQSSVEHVILFYVFRVC